MARVPYATREEVKQALDVAGTSRANHLIDLQLAAGADEIDGIMHRSFVPTIDTRSFDWPNIQTPWPWRLWLDQHEIITLTSMVSGGVNIPTSTVKLYPTGGPPYKHLELDVSTSSVFSATTTWQQTTQVTGVFGYRADEIPAGTLTPALNSTDTSVNLGIPGYRGVGSLLRIDTERMLITGRSSVTTGTTLAGNITAQNAVNLVPVASAAAYVVGETITIDGESMLVDDTLGTNLKVKRAWDGTPLTAHTAGATIYADRQLTVVRGVLGTTAASHSPNAAIAEHDAPALIRQLNLAIAVVNLIQTRAGYPAPLRRSGGSGADSDAPAVGPSDLTELWDKADRFRRKGRKRSV